MAIELTIMWAILFGAGVVIQLIAANYGHRKFNSQLAAQISLFLLLTSLFISASSIQAKYTILIIIITAYLIVNAVILAKWQFHPLRTKTQVFKTAYKLILVLLTSTLLIHFNLINNNVVAIGSLLVSLLALLKVSTLIGHSSAILTSGALSKTKTTVSIAIPARNETHALTANLRSILDSDFMRLEVLVHDDCSQDDTSQIIRSFAQDGVRFIKGITPTHSWLGKNLAYASLAGEASGDFIIFSGVDTRYQPDTIDKIVNYVESNKLDMISILPSHQKMTPLSMVIQPMRYLYMLYSSSPNKPAVLSTVWIIRRSSLESLGGFKAVENSLFPERYFARQLSKKSKYKFITSHKNLGLTTYKKPSSQQETSVRTIYPSLKKSLFNHFVLSMLLGLFFIIPIVNLIGGIVGSFGHTTLLYGLSIIANIIVYMIVINISYPQKWLIYSPIYFLIGLIMFYYLSLKSVFDYELNRVTWKGRNICYPVMLKLK